MCCEAEAAKGKRSERVAGMEREWAAGRRFLFGVSAALVPMGRLGAGPWVRMLRDSDPYP
jgi:hypothetical protein